MKHAAEANDGPIERLVADGLIRREGATYRTTRRWQADMARAAASLSAIPGAAFDLRVPIAWALVERYGSDVADARLAEWVDVFLPIEAAEQNPKGSAAGSP